MENALSSMSTSTKLLCREFAAFVKQQVLQPSWLHMIGCLAFSFFLSCSFERSDVPSGTSGIVLSFDDYSPDTWETNIDLFDAYDTNRTLSSLSLRTA